MTTPTTMLRAAISYLSATQISPRMYAFYADETSSYWVVSAADLRELGRALDDGEPDAYSLWCASYGREATRRETREITGGAS